MKRAATLTYKPRDTDFNELVAVLFDELASEYELRQVAEAVAMHVRQEKFFPMLSDIIRGIEGTAGDHAALAWPLVVNAVRHIGHYNSVAFPAPAYNYALNLMGGWIGLCRSLVDSDVKWRGKDFERFFVIGERCATWSNEPGKIQVDRYCAGVSEAGNRSLGYELPDVIDARTRAAIPDFRVLYPALGAKTAPMLEKLASAKRVTV